MQLSVSHIKGYYSLCPSLEENLGEPARGRTEV
jgi:hypothetical protein